MMSEFESLLRMVFPSWLFAYFDLIKIEGSACQFDIYLDEKKTVPEEFKDHSIRSHGYTDTFILYKTFLYVIKKSIYILEDVNGCCWIRIRL